MSVPWTGHPLDLFREARWWFATPSSSCSWSAVMLGAIVLGSCCFLCGTNFGCCLVSSRCFWHCLLLDLSTTALGRSSFGAACSWAAASIWCIPCMDLDSIVGICIAGCGGWLYTQGAQAPPSVVPDPAPEADLRPVDRSQLVGVSTSSRLTLVELPQPFVVALLQASTPDLLGDLFPSFLAHYVDHPSLTGDDYWPLRARLTRPLRAGVSARRVLAGAFDKQVRSIPVNQDNIIYVVLPCSRSSDGFVTRHYSVFAAPWWATGNWFSVSRICKLDGGRGVFERCSRAISCFDEVAEFGRSSSAKSFVVRCKF